MFFEKLTSLNTTTYIPVLILMIHTCILIRFKQW